jgi:hypothetical protein
MEELGLEVGQHEVHVVGRQGAFDRQPLRRLHDLQDEGADVDRLAGQHGADVDSPAVDERAVAAAEVLKEPPAERVLEDADVPPGDHPAVEHDVGGFGPADHRPQRVQVHFPTLAPRVNRQSGCLHGLLPLQVIPEHCYASTLNYALVGPMVRHAAAKGKPAKPLHLPVESCLAGCSNRRVANLAGES